MTASWYLVIFIYAGMLSKSDSVSITSIPMLTQQACEVAGVESKKLVQGTYKELKYVCIKSEVK